MTTLMVSGLENPNTSKPQEDSLPPHLGGHMNRTHTDRNLLTYLMEEYGIKTMLDIGCGPGGMIELAQLRGIDAFGIDGDFTIQYDSHIKPFVYIHDFTTGPAPIDGEFDLGWSVEFLEHVEEKYIPNYMEAFRLCKYLVVTAAPPGWNGHHHVNCQNQEYWEKVFLNYGFAIDSVETERIRVISSMMKGFMKMSGMFYRRVI